MEEILRIAFWPQLAEARAFDLAAMVEQVVVDAEPAASLAGIDIGVSATGPTQAWEMSTASDGS